MATIHVKNQPSYRTSFSKREIEAFTSHRLGGGLGSILNGPFKT